MAKLLFKKSVALVTAVLLIAAPLNHPVEAAANTPTTIADLLNASKPLISSSLSATLGAVNSLTTSTTGATIDPAIDTSSADKISVIIQLNGQPISEAKYSAGLTSRSFSAQSTEQAIKTEQSTFRSAASSKGISMNVNYQYNTVLNGMEVTVKANEIPKLALISGVKAISINSTYYPIPLIESPLLESSSDLNFDIDPLKQIGVDTAWNNGFTGKGVKIGVIDTGVDYAHPDLKNAYKGGYDSFYKDNDPYEEVPYLFGFEGTSHGTHVAGTIVGRGENTASEVVQKGIAYEADLYAYKVLGATYNESTGVYDTSGSSAQVIDGIEHAVKDGMDVINLSLGSNMEKGPDSPDSIAVNNAVLAGVVAVIASGNAGSDGKYYFSMGSPASSQLGISVAAATTVSTHFGAEFSAQVTDTVTSEVYSVTDAVYSNALAWNLKEANFNEILGTDPLDAVYVGLGDYSDYYEAGNVKDKVVIASRGNLTFVDKVKIAKEMGAKALILFNGNSVNATAEADLSVSIPGRDAPIGSVAFMGDDYGHIPTFDMSGYDGRALARYIKAHPEQPLHITFGKDFPMSIEAGDTIADFSSRGPNADDNYGIKPDISAPGVNILSTLPEYGALYGSPDVTFDDNLPPTYEFAYHRSSGTSMAAPHIAGLAALMVQAHPDWSPLDIRAGLTNTADVIADANGTKYDVYSQGSGRADVAEALLTPAIVESLDPITIYDALLNPTVMESQGSNLSFGSITPGAEPLSKPLQVKNTSDSTLTYTASVVMHSSVTSDPSDPIATPDVNNIEMTLGGLGANSTLTITADSSLPFTLSAQAKANAVHGVYEGEVLLVSAGLPSLHLPFVIHVGDDVADNDFALLNPTITNKRISPADPTDLSITLVGDTFNFMVIEVYGLTEGYIGRITDWYAIDPLTDELTTLPAGRLTFENIDGTYVDDSVDEYGNTLVKQLPEGQYKLGIYAVRYEGNTAKEVESVNQTIYVDYSIEGSTDPVEPTPTPTPTDGSGNGGGGGVVATPTPTPTPVVNSTHASEQLAAITQPSQTLLSLTSDTTVQGEQTVVTVTDAELQKALDAAKQATTFSIAATSTDAGKASLLLTTAQLKLLQSAPALSSIAFTWNDASVAVPLSALSGLAANAELKLEIALAPDSKSTFAKGFAEATILGTPYSFEASSVVNSVSTKISFSPDQVVRRSFSLDKGIDVSHAGALYTEGDKVFAVPAQFKKASDGSTIVTINRPGFSTYAVATRHLSFNDIQSSWANSQIQTLADKFILNGTSTNTFSPKSPVTRAQFATMLVTAIGLDKQATTNAFADVKGNEWFAQDVTAAYQAGLITGYDGNFRPNDQITRQDLTVMLARAIKLLNITITSGTASKPYGDTAKFSSYAQESIQSVTDAGLMQGVEQQGMFFFNPILPTTREAAAKVLYQLLTAANLL